MSDDLTRWDAERLLQAIAELHAELHDDEPLQVGTHVAPHEAAHRAGIEAGSPRCEAAVDYLEEEGALEWEESSHRAVGTPIFQITRRGLEMLGD